MLLQELFSKWMREKRAALGISTRGMAPMSPSNVRQLEHHARDPRLTTFVNVCHTMGEDPCKVLKKLLADAEVES